MKLTDIISLLKAGYTKDEIKELEAKENNPDPEPDPEPDDKDKRIAELEKKIKTLQKKKTEEDLSDDEKSDDDILKEMALKFL